jgi:uncharacterized membrane protein YtjA (UPF0391 family)
MQAFSRELLEYAVVFMILAIVAAALGARGVAVSLVLAFVSLAV